MPRKIERAFYHWQSTYAPDPFEKQRLDSLQVDHLYIKYFDVDWDAATHQPLPKAMIRFKERPAYQIIPTVFITNECLQQTDTAQIASLAEKIVSTISTINTNNKIDSIKEVQIDCDWSGTTKNKYFNLLRIIRQLVGGPHPLEGSKIGHPATNIQLSATVRLYQIKYKDKAGIPPVDKGMLMCYNMGNLKSISSNNSIIEIAELSKYAGELSAYPLPLDIALPIFNWKVWFRNGRYHGITEAFPDSLLSSPLFKKTSNHYQVLRDTILAGYEFRKGDLLRYETSDSKVVQEVAATISQQLKNTQARVALYHLDSVLLKKYSLYELESFYNSLR